MALPTHLASSPDSVPPDSYARGHRGVRDHSVRVDRAERLPEFGRPSAK